MATRDSDVDLVWNEEDQAYNMINTTNLPPVRFVLCAPGKEFLRVNLKSSEKMEQALPWLLTPEFREAPVIQVIAVEIGSWEGGLSLQDLIHFHFAMHLLAALPGLVGHLTKINIVPRQRLDQPMRTPVSAVTLFLERLPAEVPLDMVRVDGSGFVMGEPQDLDPLAEALEGLQFLTAVVIHSSFKSARWSPLVLRLLGLPNIVVIFPAMVGAEVLHPLADDTANEILIRLMQNKEHVEQVNLSGAFDINVSAISNWNTFPGANQHSFGILALRFTGTEDPLDESISEDVKQSCIRFFQDLADPVGDPRSEIHIFLQTRDHLQASQWLASRLPDLFCAASVAMHVPSAEGTAPIPLEAVSKEWIDYLLFRNYRIADLKIVVRRAPEGLDDEDQRDEPYATPPMKFLLRWNSSGRDRGLDTHNPNDWILLLEKIDQLAEDADECRSIKDFFLDMYPDGVIALARQGINL